MIEKLKSVDGNTPSTKSLEIISVWAIVLTPNRYVKF